MNAEHLQDLYKSACDESGITPGALTEEDDKVLGMLFDAFSVYLTRNKTRKGVWRNSGIRGMTFHLFSKAERAFREALAADDVTDIDIDHYRDAIIYACFAQILADEDEDSETSLNGTYPWEINK